MKTIVYHGSPNGKINTLIPHKSTHQKDCIYATENKVAALLFMGKGNGDLDTRISTVNGNLELVERREGVLENLYHKEGYLYELDGTTFHHYDYLWSLEVISFEKQITPINKIYYSNILEAILEEEEKGNVTVYRYPNRPKEMPLDNSDLIEKYIRFEQQGLKGSITRLLSIYPEFTSKIKVYDKKDKEYDRNKSKTGEEKSL